MFDLKQQSEMSSKDVKPEVSIDAIKEVVKKLKSQGFEALLHHDLALALTTIGFKQVCKQFGAEWNDKHQKQALKILSKSEYDLSWFGKINNNNYVALLQYCLRGDIQKVKDMIRSTSKANKPDLISTTDNFKRTALHLAVKQGFDVLAQYLINEGFSINARDRQLKTPLHYCKNELICQVLLKKGAIVTVKDNKFCTPAHYAASGSEYKVLELLLQKTNVVNECDSTMKTPIFYAIYNNSQEQVNILRILIQNGGKVNDKDIFGKTPLHYAAEMGKSRCIPILLQKGAAIDAMDKHNKTPLDLAANQKIKKIMTAYYQNKGHVFQKEEKQKKGQFSKISEIRSKENQPKSKEESVIKSSNQQIYTKELNQVSTWIRQKFFVLMKKLQQSGVKSLWHVKRPYIYTGSWAEDIEGLEDLYQTFLNVSGPEAAMRTFNILCPYEKALPTGLGKSEEAFQSFFGENWFSNDPIEKVRNLHSQSKIRNQLEAKIKEVQDLKTQLLGYRSEIQNLQNMISIQKEQLSRYEKIEDDLRKQRTKNSQQYNQNLKHLSEISDLKLQIQNLLGGEEKTQMLSSIVNQLRSKNQDLMRQINQNKLNEAAERRKCGKLFLKALSMAGTPEGQFAAEEANLYDDDAIISLYELLKGNPPNLEKRFKNADKKGVGKLSIDQFTRLLQDLSMLPQDVMSMHRITGFSFGRKTLSLQEFKTILQNRHKNRPMWEKQLIRKIKAILVSQNLSLQNFFKMIDVDGSGTIEASELRKGLQNANIFMNQNDWSNLFNLLDSDKSGSIDLNELKTLLDQEKTGKLEQLSIIKDKQQKNDESQDKKEDENQQEKQKQEDKQQQNKEEDKEENKDEEQAKQEENKEQDEVKEEEKSENKLLSDEQEFKEEYEEQDPEKEQGIVRLNGDIKIQMLMLNLPTEEQLDHVYAYFTVGDLDSIKMVNLKQPKKGVVTKLQMIEYKLLNQSQLKIYISIFKSRQFDEQNYLGEVTVEIGDIIDKPNSWAINSKFQLESGEYEKKVDGSFVLQIKWIPKEDD